MNETLLIRADASPRMGTGHMMRCLALAQEWQKAGKAIFASRQCTSTLEDRLGAEGFQIRKLAAKPGSAEDAQETVALAQQAGAAWIVVDGYQFDADYQEAIMASGMHLLFFDDYGHAVKYCADLVLNQNFGADASLYAAREPHTRLLLGPRFSVLRKEFQAWRNWQREVPTIARRVLVTLGGSDPDNVTEKVLEALKQLLDIEVTVVVGGSNPHLATLQMAISNLPSSFRLVVNAPNMAELMAGADIAIAAAGSTFWELAFMGLPSLVLVLADNQRAVAEALIAKRIALKTTPEQLAAELASLLADAERRRVMSRMGRQLVNGHGAEQIIEAICRKEIHL